MKWLFGMLFLVIGLESKILFLGDKENQFLCDGKKDTAMSLKSCSKVVAITDLNMCYFINSDLDCKKLFKGEEFNSDKVDKNDLEFSRLLSFNTVTKTSFGVKRFSDVAVLKNVMIPYGDILKPNKNIIIDFNDETKKTIYIKKGKKTLFEKTTINSEVNISKKFFSYSNDYTIIIKINKQEYLSSFSIIDKDTQKTINHTIKNVTKNISDKKSKVYIKSVILDQYGLLFDREIFLKGV